MSLLPVGMSLAARLVDPLVNRLASIIEPGRNNPISSSNNGSYQTSGLPGLDFAQVLEHQLALQRVSAAPEAAAGVNQALQMSSAAAQTAALRQHLLTALSGLGISAEEGIVLQPDAEGLIRVVNDHPDAHEVEDLFEERPDLAQVYRQLLAYETARAQAVSGIDLASPALLIQGTQMSAISMPAR